MIFFTTEKSKLNWIDMQLGVTVLSTFNLRRRLLKCILKWWARFSSMCWCGTHNSLSNYASCVFSFQHTNDWGILPNLSIHLSCGRHPLLTFLSEHLKSVLNILCRLRSSVTWTISVFTHFLFWEFCADNWHSIVWSIALP